MVLGWRPQVRLDEGVRRTVEYFRGAPVWLRLSLGHSRALERDRAGQPRRSAIRVP